MVTGTEPSAAGAWTEARLAEVRARCSVQRYRARGAGLTAREQREDSRRRRDEARQRAGDRIWPMWKARSARFDRFGPVMAMWSGDQPSAPRGGGEGDGLAVIESVVQELFDVSLLITACRSLATDPVTERLDQAVVKLDKLIRDVRLLMFRPAERHPAAAGLLSGDGPAGIRARLEDVSIELFRWADGQSDGSAALHWRDAAQCVSRALGVLNEEDGPAR